MDTELFDEISNFSDENELFDEDFDTPKYTKEDILLLISELSKKDRDWIKNNIN